MGNGVKYTVCAFLFMILTGSCGEELLVYDTSMQTPVVESYLMQGQNSLTVKLYSVESLTEIATSKPIKNLQLYINDLLLTETSSGTYTLKLAGSKWQTGETYTLRFDYNNLTVRGNTVVPAKPEAAISQDTLYRESSYWFGSDTIPEVTITWDDPDAGYYQVYIEYEGGDNSGQNFPGGGFRNRMLQPFRGNSYILRGMDVRSFGNYKIVLYKVNREYAELYEQISSTDLANPVSMLQNALGVFTAMASDTLSFTVLESE